MNRLVSLAQRDEPRDALSARLWLLRRLHAVKDCIAVGSVERPMTDANLERKFLELADGILPSAQARRLLALCWDIEGARRAADLARTATA